MFRGIKQFVLEESGQDIVEYSLLLVLVGLVVMSVLTAMGTNISNIFSKIGNRLSSAEAAIGD